MPNVLKEAPETPADPKRLRSVDVTGRQRPAAMRRMRDHFEAPSVEWAHRMDAFEPDCTGMAPGPRRQRDADRRRQAHADGRGATNETVLACRSGTRQQQIDRSAMRKQGGGGEHPVSIRQRWGAFLVQTGRGKLTAAQARSVRRRSTREEIGEMTFAEQRMIGVRTSW